MVRSTSIVLALAVALFGPAVIAQDYYSCYNACVQYDDSDARYGGTYCCSQYGVVECCEWANGTGDDDSGNRGGGGCSGSGCGNNGHGGADEGNGN